MRNETTPRRVSTQDGGSLRHRSDRGVPQGTWPDRAGITSPAGHPDEPGWVGDKAGLGVDRTPPAAQHRRRDTSNGEGDVGSRD